MMTRTLKFKSCLRNCVFGCRQHINYDHKQRSYEETQSGSKSTNHKLLFPKRSAKMINGREERKHQLAFGIQNSRVFENRSKGEFRKPRVGEIGILLKDFIGSFLIVK